TTNLDFASTDHPPPAGTPYITLVAPGGSTVPQTHSDPAGGLLARREYRRRSRIRARIPGKSGDGGSYRGHIHSGADHCQLLTAPPARPPEATAACDSLWRC